jgi:WD40 repeat protein
VKPSALVILVLSLPFLVSALLARGADADEVARLIKQLESDSFDERFKAGERLEKIGEPALEALRRAGSADGADLELHNRIDGLLKRIEHELWGERRTFKGHTGQVWHVAVSPDGKHLLTSGQDKSVRLWDVATGEELKRFNCAEPVVASAFSPDGTKIFSGGGPDFTKKGSYLGLWDVGPGKELRRFKGHERQVLSVAFCPNGREAISCSLDGTLRVWNIETGEEVRRIAVYEDGVRGFALSPDGKQVATCAHFAEDAQLWDLTTGKVVRSFTGPGSSVNALAFSADGKRLLTAGGDGIGRLWDVASGKLLKEYDGHKGLLFAIAFTHDGKGVLTGGADRKVRLWDRDTGKERHRYDGHTGDVTSLAALPGGLMASAGADGTVRLCGAR